MLTFCYTQVIDTNEASISAGGALDDVSKVEKFKIDDAKYEASGGSDFRKFRSGKRKTEPVQKAGCKCAQHPWVTHWVCMAHRLVTISSKRRQTN